MKKNKFLIGLALSSACLVGLASCGTQGIKGDKGDSGINGTNGKDGENGKDGTSVLTGSGVPSSNLGNDGDKYIDTYTFDYYSKSNGTWSKIGSIKGQSSESKGEQGASVRTGKGVPEDTLGNDGDSYIDTSTFDYYVKSNGKWSKEGSIKGDKGSSGQNGSSGTDGKTAWSNTIIPSDNGYGYVTQALSTEEGTTYATFTMHPLSDDYKATLLELTDNSSKASYSTASKNLDFDNSTGLYYKKVEMKDGGYIVKGTFDTNTADKTITLKNEDTDGGTVTCSPSKDNYKVGEKVTFTIKPSNKYVLKALKVSGNEIDIEDLEYDETNKQYTYSTYVSEDELTIEPAWAYTGTSKLSISSDIKNGSIQVWYKDNDITESLESYNFNGDEEVEIRFISTNADYNFGSASITKGQGVASTIPSDKIKQKDGYYYYTHKFGKDDITINAIFKIITIRSIDGLMDFNEAITGTGKYDKNPISYNNETVRIDYNSCGGVLDLKDKTWEPINLTNVDNFIFYGNSVTIENLTIDKETAADVDTPVGFFGDIKNCDISYTQFKNANVTGVNNVGVIAGRATNTTIRGCPVISSSVIAKQVNNAGGESVGLFVGNLISESGKDTCLTSCAIAGSDNFVKGTDKLGGFVGCVSGNGSFGFSNCYTSKENAVTLTIEFLVNSSSDLYGRNIGSVQQNVYIYEKEFSYDQATFKLTKNGQTENITKDN